MAGTRADLDRTYAPRLAEFVSDERFGAWRCKLYGLADPAKGVRAELLDATRERAGAQPPGGRLRRLVRDRARRRVPDRARVLVAGGRTSCISARSSARRSTALEPVEWTPAGCVYELAIIEFERRAWIDDVIGNPDGPDVERYLGRRFGGLV